MFTDYIYIDILILSVQLSNLDILGTFKDCKNPNLKVRFFTMWNNSAQRKSPTLVQWNMPHFDMESLMDFVLSSDKKLLISVST